MYTRVLLVSVTLAVVSARPQHGHDHGHGNEHGHAFSSQSIVLHQSHEPHQQHHHENHYEHQEGHHGHQVSHHGYQGTHHGHEEEQHIDYYAHPKYEYEYKVVDPHTHDEKFQHEHRDGDAVKGVYSLHQPDGTVRVVHYQADKHSGFNADVKYEGHAKHIVPEQHHHHHLLYDTI